MIRIRGLRVELGQFSLRGVDLDVAEGEYFVLLGPTGAGKTVLIECLAGLQRPDAGEICLAGRLVNGLRPEERGIGYLPQDYSLFPHLSVSANIGFGLRIRRRPAREIGETTRRLAGMLHIEHLLPRTVAHLSGGEQQRVALARALAIEPRVLLLDEPLSALDEQTRENLCRELRRVHEEAGTTTVHISHSFEETLAVADRIAIINQGRIEQVGRPREVFGRPCSEFVARFVRTENILRGQAHPNGAYSRVQVGDLGLLVPGPVSGPVCLTLRPEEISISRFTVGRSSSIPSDNFANTLPGRLTRATDKGALIRLELDVGLPLIALITRHAYDALSLGPGDALVAHFPPEACHAFPIAG